MKDERIDKLPTCWSITAFRCSPKQKVLIHGEWGAEPLLGAIFRKSLQAGAYPFVVPYTSDWIESTCATLPPNSTLPYMSLSRKSIGPTTPARVFGRDQHQGALPIRS